MAWVAWAVAASDALAIDNGSPGAPALRILGSVGSHWPSSGCGGGRCHQPASAAPPAVDQDEKDAAQSDHHSIIRVTNGVMPLVRTGEILTTEPV